MASSAVIYGEYYPLEARIAHKKNKADQRRAWLEQQHSKGARCHYCRNRTTLEPRGYNNTARQVPGTFHATLDHATPTSRGGADSPPNYRLACNTCNLLKADMLEREYIAMLIAEGIR